VKQKLRQPLSTSQGSRTKYNPGRTVPFNIEDQDELLPERIGKVPTMHPLGLVGNIDPVTGRPYADAVLRDEESSGPRGGEARVGIWLGDTLSALQELLAMQRALIPVTVCVIDGPSTIPAGGTSSEYAFMLDSKPVPALRFLVQNNTAAILYYGLNLPAFTGTFQLAAGGILNLTNVMVGFISFYTAAATPVTGIRNQSASTGNGIVIQAWSNPEWKDMWGAIR
jgi:hypothetical protein